LSTFQAATVYLLTRKSWLFWQRTTLAQAKTSRSISVSAQQRLGLGLGLVELWEAGADPGSSERGGGKAAKPRTERRRRECRRGVWGPPPENFEKLDAISCNLAYIFGIRMASDIIQNWAFAEQKTVMATISKPTDIR